MEMPPYHLPTLRGVLGRALERVWLFMRKITTIVVAVAVVVFVLLQFPGIDERAHGRTTKTRKGKGNVAAFFKKDRKARPYVDKLRGRQPDAALIIYWDEVQGRPHGGQK